MPRDKRMSWNGKVEFAFSLLPFLTKKFGVRNSGYPQIPKRFCTKNKVRFKIKKSKAPSRKKYCFLAVGQSQLRGGLVGLWDGTCCFPSTLLT